MVSTLFVAGTVTMVTGFCMDMVISLIRKYDQLFAIYTIKLAIVTIATMIYLIEFKEGRLTVFDVFGKNALFVFSLSAFLPKVLALIRIPVNPNANGEHEIRYINPWNWLYQKLLVNIPGDPRFGSLLFALCVITFMWAICWWMDKKKIYIKVNENGQ
jgi:predicted acyltransferase